jgi:hypothetical protein
VVDMRHQDITMKWIHCVPLGETPTSGVECVFGEFDVDGTDGTEAQMTSWPGEVPCAPSISYFAGGSIERLV